MPLELMDTLDHMNPSLDDGFHIATHLIEPWSFGGHHEDTSTFDSLPHCLREVIPHISEDVEPYDDMHLLLRCPNNHWI
jgi:hypothetical protein